MIKKVLILGILFCCISTLDAQKYNFVNYSVDNGLIQSQANSICRDNMGHLWVSTMGGVSCYDGKTFKNYTTSNGLLSNIAYSITCDSLNNILICTDKGLSVFDGNKFSNYTFNYHNKNHRVISVLPINTQEYLVLAGARLFKVKYRRVESYFINSDTTLQFTALAQTPEVVFAASFKKGLFVLENNNWSTINFPKTDEDVFFIKRIDITRSKKSYFLTNAGIYEFRFNNLIRSSLPKEIQDRNDIGCIASDDKNNLWLGTFKGALVINGRNEFHYYNSTSGCTDNSISNILFDNENNIWLASDGQGIFRYSVCPFTYYDETNGLPHPVVMSIVKTKKGIIYSGTYGGGLVKFSNGKMESFALPSNSVAAQQILSCAVDANDILWVGTQNNKIWKFNGRNFISVEHYKGIPPGSISELFFDSRQRLWVATAFGFGYIKDEKFKLVRSNEFTWNFAEAGTDSILITTNSELLLYSMDSCSVISKNEQVKTSDVTGIVKGEEGNYWLLTNGYGILIWNLALDSVLTNITTRNGLNSDFIYNIKRDVENNYWIGTGAGINKISSVSGFEKFKISRYGRAEGMFGQESNKSAVMQNLDGKIWFGTTKGLFIYNAADEQMVKYPAKIILQGVKLFSQAIGNKEYNDSLSSWYNIPINLSLPHTENHLTFSFAAVNFNNPDKILYQYMIEGLEKTWSEPSIENTVIYPAIPPGKYIFKVKIYDSNTSILAYSFEIKAPFYSTFWFRLILVVSLILLGVGLQGMRNYNKKRKEFELQKLREEEQNKVRQRTAEDFHDEVGNKLTRISLLADILKSKSENESIISLSDKIKENTNELYSGTKDIIWALNPENDNLTEMLLYLEAFGNNLVQDSEVKFSTSLNIGFANGIVLPMGFNRNITMIFKEAINNALKHSKCNFMKLESELIQGEVLKIMLTDDGVGIDDLNNRRGSGLQNMAQRASRMNGELEITKNGAGKGTCITLTLKLSK